MNSVSSPATCFKQAPEKWVAAAWAVADAAWVVVVAVWAVAGGVAFSPNIS
jgi:hypothetical protein